MKKTYVLLLLSIFMGSCHKDPAIDNSMLDSGLFFDQSIYHPDKYLVSIAKPNPTAAEAAKPVVIAIHGYGATTFEWDEFRTWAAARTDFSISQVLLGGHGQDYQTFKNATWKDWQQPIINEFNKLESEGYKNISFAGSSTGCTLILEMLANGYFDAHLKPRHVFLIDPIIVPADKNLSLIGALGPIVGYTIVDNTSGEDKYYFHYRPQETLKQLNNIITIVRKDLQDGIILPANCSLKVFKADHDDVADAVSAVLIYKGVKTEAGNPAGVSLVSSQLHVFTRLDHRENTPSATDRQNQINAFTEIAGTVTK